jgi:hypothetical protein
VSTRNIRRETTLVGFLTLGEAHGARTTQRRCTAGAGGRRERYITSEANTPSTLFTPSVLMWAAAISQRVVPRQPVVVQARFEAFDIAPAHSVVGTRLGVISTALASPAGSLHVQRVRRAVRTLRPLGPNRWLASAGRSANAASGGAMLAAGSSSRGSAGRGGGLLAATLPGLAAVAGSISAAAHVRRRSCPVHGSVSHPPPQALHTPLGVGIASP